MSPFPPALQPELLGILQSSRPTSRSECRDEILEDHDHGLLFPGAGDFVSDLQSCGGRFTPPKRFSDVIQRAALGVFQSSKLKEAPSHRWVLF